jgi:hypothetical protein
MQGTTLTTAWVGDSRMVLGRQKKKGWRSAWEAIDLSTDHKPTTPEERARILDNHGRVERCVRGQRCASMTGRAASITHVFLFPANCPFPPCAVPLTVLSCRLVDETGQPMGPYRVWLQYAWLPGLAMSRALGDRLAHS